jgi:hypothetical protein
MGIEPFHKSCGGKSQSKCVFEDFCWFVGRNETHRAIVELNVVLGPIIGGDGCVWI